MTCFSTQDIFEMNIAKKYFRNAKGMQKTPKCAKLQQGETFNAFKQKTENDSGVKFYY